MTNIFNSINCMSDVQVKSVFKVGKEDYTRKNKGKSYDPQQVKQLMIRSGEYRFITPGQLLLRKKNLRKTFLEKVKMSSLKQSSSFGGKLLFTNKLK